MTIDALADGRSPGAATFVAALDRVDALLEQEDAALKALSAGTLRQISDGKARCLLEISRASRALSAADAPGIEPRLAILRARLDRNRAALGLHLEAARGIAALIGRAIADEESDGTYDAAGRRSAR